MPSSITLTVDHLSTSTSFFLACLQPLGYVYRGKTFDTVGFGPADKSIPPDFWLSQSTPSVPAGAAHVAFPAASQDKVQEFFITAIKAGGKVHGEPLCRDPHTGYYSAAVIDLDGNSVEAVYRPGLLTRKDSGSDTSRPNSAVSAGSVASAKSSRSPAQTMASKAPTHVSKASTAQRSNAPVVVRESATEVSRAPTGVSRTPTSVSRSPTQISKAPTTTSKAPTVQLQSITQTTPTGETITTLITEAKNTISVARDLVNAARPAFDSSKSAPNIHAAVNGAASLAKAISPPTSAPSADPNSHKPSDTIVGTLLGVAAGAALHYAYTKVNEKDKSPPATSAQVPRPPVARTSTEPSIINGAAREYYYHEYAQTTRQQPYAIEAAPIEMTYDGASFVSGSGQRYIMMAADNDERLSSFTGHRGIQAPSTLAPSTIRPRRRSSFSGIDVKTLLSNSRASQDPKSRSQRTLEAPPSAYRAPTAITAAETSTGRSRASSKSRTGGSTHRSASASGSKTSRRSSRTRHSSRDSDDEDYRSAATTMKPHKTSRAPSVSRSEAVTVVPIRPSPTPSRAPSRSSTIIRPEDRPLPPSRAGTWADGDGGNTSRAGSATSKANRTVIGKMLEREKQEGSRGLTKSVVGKIEDAVNDVRVSNREIRPDDSVSQIGSSAAASNSSRKSRRA